MSVAVPSSAVNGRIRRGESVVASLGRGARFIAADLTEPGAAKVLILAVRSGSRCRARVVLIENAYAASAVAR